MADLRYSTIRSKSPAATNPKTTDNVLKMSQVFSRLNQSLPVGAKPPGSPGPQERMLASAKLIYEKEGTIPVVICKKGKKSGKSLFREGTMSKADILRFTQKKKNKNKTYETPLEFIAETKVEYTQALANANKIEKKAILPWEAKEIANKEYRIRFRRHNTEVKPGKPEEEGPSDTAFYFERQDEWKKMMNFLKSIKLLEASGTDFQQKLKAFSANFRNQVVVKFRQAIQERALAIKQASVQKDAIVKKSVFLNEYDKKIWRELANQWKTIALIRDKSNKRLEEERLARRRQLEAIVNSSAMLQTLDPILTARLTEAWTLKALERASPNKEDVNILFNTLELPSTITSPSVRVEVKALNLPDLLRLNGRLLQGNTREFRLSCIKRLVNTKENVSYWGILAGSSDISDDQRRFVKEAYIASDANLEGEKFSLHFEDFPLEHLEKVEVTVNVFDENRKLKAYCYTSLRGLQLASKRGKNAWLCLSTNEADNVKLPLLHLKIEARATRNAQDRKNLAARAGNFARFGNTNVIEDTFFNYSFRMPNVTPERAPLLDLLPANWNIMDAKTKELERNSSRAEFIQRAKYRLAKHYHEATSRQIARLKKGAFIWAELQNDIMTYFPQREGEDKSQLYLSEEQLRQITSPDAENQTRDSKSSVISYLFKRDMWESKHEWVGFYKELERLSKKGFPPQNRLDIWSEMGRAVYFIKLTEIKAQQATELNRSTGLSDDDDIIIRSRKVYEILKEGSQKNCSIFYQNLEDDIRALRASFGVSKLPFEHNIRHICRAFTYWAKLFSDPAQDSRSQYLIAYSRTIATLCYGFLVCQTCSFVEGTPEVEEHQVFWLLISLATYILSSYFEMNEEPAGVDRLTSRQNEELTRRRNAVNASMLRCNQVKGIKSDILLLKVLLEQEQPEIHEKLEELGLPLEFYFSDHMLSLFFTLFNPGLTFRIWDVLFFEGSSTNQVKCNRMIVCIIYTLLKECKQQILLAKEAEDIKFIIELYARFQTSYGDFLKKCYDNCNTIFVQTLPKSDDFFGKLSLIKYALFSGDYNKIDNKTKDFEKSIESHYQYVFDQNSELYKFIKQKYAYRPEAAEAEVLSYPILSNIVQKFIASFGQPINKPAEEGNVRIVKERIADIWVKVYSMTTPIQDVRKTVLNVKYGHQILSKKDFNPLSVDLEGVFNTGAIGTGVFRELNVELWDESDPARPKKVKAVNLDLRALPVNVVNRLNLRLGEQDENVYNEYFAPAQVELAILIETAPEPEAHIKAAKKDVQPFLLKGLDDVHYKGFRSQTIQSSVAGEILTREGLTENVLSQYSVLRRSPAAWKENFVMTEDEFVTLIARIAPCWNDEDLRNAYKSVSRASRNSVFYIIDFFLLLILYVKGTLNQKHTLLFDLLTGFEHPSLNATTGEVSLHTLKGLIGHLYDVFMLHIPYNQLENMIDLAATGHSSCIKQVIINEQIDSARVQYPRQVLNKLTNFVHLNTHNKNIHAQTAEILKLLRNIYEKEILPTVEGRNSLLSQNTIDIIYFVDGQNHRMTLYVDQNWNQQEQQFHPHERIVPKLLDCYREVVPLTAPGGLYSKDQFVQILQRLPLLNFLSSFEDGDSTNTYMLLNELKYTVLMENEPLLGIKPSYEPVIKSPQSKKEKFALILRNWPNISRQAGGRSKPSSPSRSGKQDYLSVQSRKLDVFLPFSKIVENIKRAFMRNINENMNKSGSPGVFNARLYNEHFYTLDFDITLILNRNIRINNVDPNSTPFLAIMEYVESASTNNQVQNLEVVFALKSNRIPDSFRDQYQQLAQYRHSDGSTEWLPCKVVYKFQFGAIDANIDSTVVDGFGVVFERFPRETFIKKSPEVIISQQIDMDELLLKRIDRTTLRAVTVDQIADHMKKSANSPLRPGQSGFSDPLNAGYNQRPYGM